MIPAAYQTLNLWVFHGSDVPISIRGLRREKPWHLCSTTTDMPSGFPDIHEGGLQLTASADYVELATLLVSDKDCSLAARLRHALPYLPIALTLGVEPNVLCASLGVTSDDFPDESMNGLLLTDMGSGATRQVRALWMHVLYGHTLSTFGPGVVSAHLSELQFNSTFGLAHAVHIAAILSQFTLALYAISSRHQREGWLIIGGLAVKGVETLFGWWFPKYQKPRCVPKARYYALHKGMTTNHILIVKHTPSNIESEPISMEDTASPMMRQPAKWEETLRMVVTSMSWAWRVACVVLPATSYLIPIALLLGSIVQKVLSATYTGLPKHTTVTVIKKKKETSILEMLIAAGRYTGQISVGLTEAMLPDRFGGHADYYWIKNVIEVGAKQAGVHPKWEGEAGEKLFRRVEAAEAEKTTTRGESPPGANMWQAFYL